jgi:hypothetical protein
MEAMTERAVPIEEMKSAMREVVHEEFERIGLRTETADARDDTRKDQAFLRRLRLWTDGAATKVGYAIILGGLGLLGAIFLAGLKVQIGK